MDFRDKFTNWLLKENERMQEKRKELVRKMPDEKIRSALRHPEQMEGWALALLREEARRRHLKY